MPSPNDEQPQKDIPTSVVERAREINRKLDALLTKRGQTVPPPQTTSPAPSPA